MSRKQRSRAVRQPGGRPEPRKANPAPGPVRDRRVTVALLAAVMVLVAIVVIGADIFFGAMAGGGGSPSPRAATASVAIQPDVVVQGKGGYWTNVSTDRLAQMLEHKDFTLVNVKTPYFGEIDGYRPVHSLRPAERSSLRAAGRQGRQDPRLLPERRTRAPRRPRRSWIWGTPTSGTWMAV